MRLLIPGNVPALKNQKQIAYNPRTGKTFITASVAVKAWMRVAVSELQHQFREYRIARYPVGIVMVFYFDSLRSRDLDNACSSVMDALKHAGVIEDDDFKHIDTIQLQYGGLSKDSPRCEIFLDD